VTFSDIGGGAWQRGAAYTQGEMTGSRGGFVFSSPSNEAANHLSPDQAKFGVLPAAFSHAVDTPFQADWAHFLQEELPNDSDPSANDPNETLGEAPEETNTSTQFLRRETILLGPGEYQLDLSLQYVTDESDFVIARLNNNALQVDKLTRRQRLLLMPFEFRLGVTPGTQFFVNVPLGWSNAETVLFGQDEFANGGGVGDVSLGLTRQLWRADQYYPNILGTFAVSAPTGNRHCLPPLA